MFHDWTRSSPSFPTSAPPTGRAARPSGTGTLPIAPPPLRPRPRNNLHAGTVMSSTNCVSAQRHSLGIRLTFCWSPVVVAVAVAVSQQIVSVCAQFVRMDVCVCVYLCGNHHHDHHCHQDRPPTTRRTTKHADTQHTHTLTQIGHITMPLSTTTTESEQSARTLAPPNLPACSPVVSIISFLRGFNLI